MVDSHNFTARDARRLLGCMSLGVYLEYQDDKIWIVSSNDNNSLSSILRQSGIILKNPICDGVEVALDTIDLALGTAGNPLLEQCYFRNGMPWGNHRGAVINQIEISTENCGGILATV